MHRAQVDVDVEQLDIAVVGREEGSNRLQGLLHPRRTDSGCSPCTSSRLATRSSSSRRGRSPGDSSRTSATTRSRPPP